MNTITIQNPIVTLRFDERINQILEWIQKAHNTIHCKPTTKAAIVNRIVKKMNIHPPKEHLLETCILDELWTLLHEKHSILRNDIPESSDALLDEYRKHINDWDTHLDFENRNSVVVVLSLKPQTFILPGAPVQRNYRGVFNLI